MKRRTLSVRLIALSLIAGFTLSACGIKGDLKTPPPLFGEDIRTDVQKAEVEKAKAERAKRAAESAAKKAKEAAQSPE